MHDSDSVCLCACMTGKRYDYELHERGAIEGWRSSPASDEQAARQTRKEESSTASRPARSWCIVSWSNCAPRTVSNSNKFVRQRATTLHTNPRHNVLCKYCQHAPWKTGHVTPLEKYYANRMDSCHKENTSWPFNESTNLDETRQHRKAL